MSLCLHRRRHCMVIYGMIILVLYQQSCCGYRTSHIGAGRTRGKPSGRQPSLFPDPSGTTSAVSKYVLFKLSNCDTVVALISCLLLSTSSTIVFCIIWQYVPNDGCIPVTVPPVRLPEDRSRKLIPLYLAAALRIILLLISLSRSTVFQPHGGPDRLFLLAPAVPSPVPGQSSVPPSPPELRVLGSIPPSFGCCFSRPNGRYVSVILRLEWVAKARLLVDLWCRHLSIHSRDGRKVWQQIPRRFK